MPSASTSARPSAVSTWLTASRSKAESCMVTSGSSSPARCCRSDTKRASASPRRGCASPPTRRSRRPSGVVTIRPRTSGTAQIVSFRSPALTSRTCTSTPHSKAMRLIRSWVFWERGQPTMFRWSSTPWTINPPWVMAMAAMVSRTSSGTPRLKSSCSCSTRPNRCQNASAARCGGTAPSRGTEAMIGKDYQIFLENRVPAAYFRQRLSNLWENRRAPSDIALGRPAELSARCESRVRGAH